MLTCRMTSSSLSLVLASSLRLECCGRDVVLVSDAIGGLRQDESFAPGQKYIQLVQSDAGTPQARWILEVRNDVANNHIVRVKGFMDTTQASVHTHINIRICGQERI